jgi:membrane protease YdiL (CAAX protease family)
MNSELANEDGNSRSKGTTVEDSSAAAASAEPRPGRCTVWFPVVGAPLGMLAAVMLMLVLTREVARHAFTPAHHFTAQEGAMIFATGSALGEWLALFVLWWILRRQHDSLRRLGLWKGAPWFGWVAALLVAAYSVIPAVVGSHLPVSQMLFEPSLFHIYTTLVVGSGAGLCEEVIFRGYVMTRLADAGYGRLVQVIAGGLVFGLAHSGYGFRLGWRIGLGIMIPTAILGALYAVIYLLSRRSLMPGILSHFLNDAIVLPWVFVQMATLHR